MEYTDLYCSDCGKCCDSSEVYSTAFGTSLCTSCYEKYSISDKAPIEDFIALVDGKTSVKYYDADYLGKMVTSWIKYKDEINQTQEQLLLREMSAIRLGLR